MSRTTVTFCLTDGGGFGIIPAFLADQFGAKNVGKINENIVLLVVCTLLFLFVRKRLVVYNTL